MEPANKGSMSKNFIAQCVAFEMKRFSRKCFKQNTNCIENRGKMFSESKL